MERGRERGGKCKRKVRKGKRKRDIGKLKGKINAK